MHFCRRATLRRPLASWSIEFGRLLVRRAESGQTAGEFALTHREAFFCLEATDRQRVRVLVGVLAVAHILQFSSSPHGANVGSSIGILGNVLVLYWCAFLRTAPNSFFTLLPYIWWFTAMFDGFEVYRALSGVARTGVVFFLGVANLLVLPFLAAPVLRFQRMSRAAASASGTEGVP